MLSLRLSSIVCHATNYCHTCYVRLCENSERMIRCIRESGSKPRALKSAKEDDTAQEKLRPHSLRFTFSAKQSIEKE